MPAGKKPAKSQLVKKVSKSEKASLLFPVGRTLRHLKHGGYARRIGTGAPVYLAAVLEYCVAEILELAGNAAVDNRKRRITPRFLRLAISEDVEINKMLKGVTIAEGGVHPHVDPFLLMKKQTPEQKEIARQIQNFNPSKGKGKGKEKEKEKGKEKAISKTVDVLGTKTLAFGQKLQILQGDISVMKVDAIVHPTDSTLSLAGMVGNALKKAGGHALENEALSYTNKHGNLGEAEAAMTSGHGLPAKFVIHVNSPSWNSKNARDLLKQTINNALDLASQKNIQSIAFPSIGSGNNGFPKAIAANIILEAIKSYFQVKPANFIKEVMFILYDEESIEVYQHELSKLN